MPIRIIILLIFLAAAGGCATVRNLNAANEFDTTTQKYNLMLRWDELATAGATFAAKSVKEEFAARAKTAKGVTITDYRIKSVECRPEANEGKVVVDIDYIVSPSVTLKTVEDVQIWRYAEENRKKSWRLTSLPPEFK